MDKEGNCCFCGKEYFEYGFATWGCWSFEDEKRGMGEEKRCCIDCYEKTVVPERRKKTDAMEMGTILSVCEDIPEVLFESTTRNVKTLEGCSHKFYDNGLYQIITYGKADSLDKLEIKIQNVGKKIEAVKELKKKIRFAAAGFTLEPSINGYEEIKLDNPYDESEIDYVKFEKIIYSGKSLFKIFNKGEEKNLNIDYESDEGKRYYKLRKISRAKSLIVIFLQQLFGIEEGQSKLKSSLN